MVKKLEIISTNLLGDTVMQSPAIRKWKQNNPDGWITYHTTRERGSYLVWQGNPYIDELLIHNEIPADTEGIRMDAWAAHTWARENGKLLAQGFGALIDTDVSPDEIAYDYFITSEEEAHGEYLVEKLGGGKPVVVVARHSASCSSNDPKIRIPNKCIPNKEWVVAARWLEREGFLPVAVGSHEDLEDHRYDEWVGEKFYGYPLREVVALCRASRFVASVDTGIRHLASAVGAHLLTVSCAIGPELIRCVPVRQEQKIHEVFVPMEAANAPVLINGMKEMLKA